MGVSVSPALIHNATLCSVIKTSTRTPRPWRWETVCVLMTQCLFLFWPERGAIYAQKVSIAHHNFDLQTFLEIRHHRNIELASTCTL
jgi:hypothetical protein